MKRFLRWWWGERIYLRTEFHGTKRSCFASDNILLIMQLLIALNQKQLSVIRKMNATRKWSKSGRSKTTEKEVNPCKRPNRCRFLCFPSAAVQRARYCDRMCNTKKNCEWKMRMKLNKKKLLYSFLWFLLMAFAFILYMHAYRWM